MVTVRSPSAFRSTTARSERPISRWISCVRPLCLPRAASRGERVCVARGSIPYSAVTQPCPLPRRNGGHALLHARGTQHARVPELHQHRAFSVTGEAAREADLPQLIRRAAARTRGHQEANQRRAAADVLSLAGPLRSHRTLGETRPVCRAVALPAAPSSRRSPHRARPPRTRQCTPTGRRRSRADDACRASCREGWDHRPGNIPQSCASDASAPDQR